MIELGLVRIGKLLDKVPQPWKAVHVAGTNGKGTICSNIANILSTVGLRCGRFTSPHTLDYWDNIQVPHRFGGVKPVPFDTFKYIQSSVKQRNDREAIGATEFEIHTATAFEIFNKYNVDVGIVEVGLGGALDATNILAQKSVTVISKIGLDHQAFLGNTLKEITKHKAGIMRSGVPCVLEDTNVDSVKSVVHEHARRIGVEIVSSTKGPFVPPDGSSQTNKLGSLRAPHMWQNFTCAYTASKIVYPGLALPDRFYDCVGAGKTLPGRLTEMQLHRPYNQKGQRMSVLLDGAHNEQAAEALGAYVDVVYAEKSGIHALGGRKKITWLLGMSKGRQPQEILKHLVKQDDTVVAVEFGGVVTMPWVEPLTSADIVSTALEIGCDPRRVYDCGKDVRMALATTSKLAADCPIVIAGSLYLVSDILQNEREEQARSRQKLPCHNAVWRANNDAHVCMEIQRLSSNNETLRKMRSFENVSGAL